MHHETIVIIHGFGGHRWLMRPLAGRLQRAGYQTLNWGYRSLFRDIETHALRLRSDLEKLSQQADISRLHVVAHSMGSLVALQILQQM